MSDQSDDEPDLTEDPRKQGTGSGGYPESEQGEEPSHEGTEDAPENPDAPDTSSDADSDAGTATGNPRNAG